MHFNTPRFLLNRPKLPFILALICLCIAAFISPVSASTQIHFNEHKTKMNLKEHYLYYFDQSSELEIEDVREFDAHKWIENKEGKTDFKMLTHPLWIKLVLQNNAAQKEHLIGELRYYTHDNVDIYIFDKEKQIEHIMAGDLRPFTDRKYVDRAVLFPVDIGGTTEKLDIYIKVKTEGPVIVPIYLWQEHSYHEFVRSTSLAYGTFFGAVLILMALISLLYIILKDKIFLYYLFCSGCNLFMRASALGFCAMYLWPEKTWPNNNLTFISLCLFTFSFSLYAYYFLNLKKVAPIYGNICRAFMASALLLLALYSFLPYITLFHWAVFLIIAGIAFITFASGDLWLRRNIKSARFFCIGFSIFLILGGSNDLAYMGWLPLNLFTENAVLVGTALEIMFLSVAFGDRISEERKETLALEASYTVKDQLVTKLSHELLPPINGILGLSELMKDSQLDKNQRTFINTINESGEQLLNYINHMLDLSNANISAVNPGMHSFDIKDLCQICHKTAEVEANGNAVSFHFDIQGDPNLQVYGDRNNLQQLLSEILKTALIVTQKGRITCIINKLAEHDDSIVVQFSLRNSGLSIPEEMQHLAFDPFTSNGSKLTRPDTLGLALCKKHVELLNGTINVVNQAKKYPIINIVIPFNKRPPSDLADTSSTSNKPFAKKHIMIVEENKTHQMIISNLLSRLGIEYVIAESSQQAIDIYKFSGEIIDLVLLDCELAEENGFTCAKRLKTEQKTLGLRDIPIIAMSVYQAEILELQCNESGMNGFLSKPISLERLEHILNQHLSH